LRPQSKSTSGEFLDGHAQGIILTVIFQSIDAKICNRASFRQGVQDLTARRRQLDRRRREESGYSQLREPGTPVAQPRKEYRSRSIFE
jgi:hypothetical protein